MRHKLTFCFIIANPAWHWQIVLNCQKALWERKRGTVDEFNNYLWQIEKFYFFDNKKPKLDCNMQPYF